MAAVEVTVNSGGFTAKLTNTGLQHVDQVSQRCGEDTIRLIQRAVNGAHNLGTKLVAWGHLGKGIHLGGGNRAALQDTRFDDNGLAGSHLAHVVGYRLGGSYL